MLVLFSYSPNGAINTSCSCHPRYDEWESYFRITSHETEEELINEILLRSQEDDRRGFDHLVFRGTPTFGKIRDASSRIFDGSSIDYSIKVFAKEDTDDSYDEARATENRLQEMLDNKIKLHKSKK